MIEAHASTRPFAPPTSGVSMKKFALALVAAAALTAPTAVFAQQYQPPQQAPQQYQQPAPIGTTVLASQTVLTGTLEQALNSKTANVGDPVILDLQPPFPNDDPRFTGGRIYGHVNSVTHAASTTKGGLTLAFDRIELSDGTVASVAGETMKIDSTKGGNTAGRAIVGGLVGQVVGNYIGKHIGSDVGGALGAVGGAIYAANMGTNINVPQGASVQLKTTQNATVTGRRQAGAPDYNNNPNPYPTPR
jgi:outer membrane lipoprotein SlyB